MFYPGQTVTLPAPASSGLGRVLGTVQEICFTDKSEPMALVRYCGLPVKNSVRHGEPILPVSELRAPVCCISTDPAKFGHVTACLYAKTAN